MSKGDGAKPMFGWPVAGWHRYFAWKPVQTFDGRLMWLRFIHRRLIQRHDYLDGGPDNWWQYKAVETNEGASHEQP